jgi:hypothetical protein
LRESTRPARNGRAGSWDNPGMGWEADSELVTLAKFAFESEFLMARGRLESAGIECFCPNLYSGLYIEAVGRTFTLQVRSEDLDDARALLESSGGDEAEGGEA